jgi:hypothetical protein
MIRPEDLKKMTPAQRAALSRKEVNARLQGQMKKPVASTSRPKPLLPLKPKRTKKATPSPSPKKTLGPLPKNPTLNDYLKRGLRPPTVGKTPPPDYDVIIPGFNDPVTIKKYNQKKKGK